ncbi:MAG: Holliday junction branch migration protein RuvA [Clostridia bacterium]|nr:Holliday junction branch migration protein RuvA [Clostridia bacterium]
MFYYLNGKLAVCQPNLAVIDCGGVGFKCSITMNTYKAISGKDSVKLFTYLNVKEDALDIYGFETEQELQFFTLLISISGVGPKVAIAILSELQPDAFANCIITSDIKRLTKAQGVGTKLAQRICLELKDKIAKTKATEGSEIIPEDMPVDDVVADAVAVLMALGYTKNESQQAVSRCSADETNALVKQALRLLAKNI